LTKLKVLLVEDHAIVRQGIRSLLEEESDILVVGEAGDGSQALEQAERLSPDIVLMDLSMPGVGGIEATRQIRERFPAMRVIVLSMHESEEYVFRVLQAGASGYVLKRATTTELVLALRAVAAGSTFLSPSISQILIGDFVQRATSRQRDQEVADLLTPRERQVLQFVAQGYSNRQIAEQLHISIKTVETHRGNMMSKLDVHDRASLIRYARESGLITLET
jgi:two-component system response regulator NreC